MPDEVRDVLPSLHAMWLWTGENSGGYGETPSFRGQPSVYQTAWALRVAGALGVSTQAVDADALASYLQGVVRNPQSIRELPPLQALHLALQALGDLHRSGSATDVAAALDAFRDGTRYRPADGAASTIGSTVLAIQSMQLAGVPIPADTRSSIAADLTANAGRTLSPDQMVNVLLPELEVAPAVLSSGQLDALRPQLGRQLTALVGATPPTSGVNLTFLSRAATLARSFDLASLVHVPHIDFASMTSYDGEVSLAGGSDASGDAQATYYALQLGMKPTPRLLDTVGRTELRVGWLGRPSQATPQFTYYGIVVDHALGFDGYDAPARKLVASWLQAPPSFAVASLMDSYYAVAAARALHVSIPAAVSDWAAHTLEAPPAGMSSGALTWVARLGYLLGLSISGQISDAGGGGTQGTIRDVFATWTWSQVLGDTALTTTARAAVHAFALPDGTYRSAAVVTGADLRSTVMGCLITGTACAPEMHAFVRGGLAWMFEPAPDSSDGAELLTSYLWALGSGRTSDWAGAY